VLMDAKAWKEESQKAVVGGVGVELAVCFAAQHVRSGFPSGALHLKHES